MEDNQTFGHKDSRGFTGFFACNCYNHAYHSNCKDCNCQVTDRRISNE